MTEKQNIVPGRPDMTKKEFGYTKAKRHMPYVFSRDANASLVHKVKDVEFLWYEVHRDYLIRLDSPRVFIRTKCQQTFFIKRRPNREPPQMCEVPSPDAVLCARCHGQGSNFRKGKTAVKERQAARLKLGCVTEVSSSAE